MRSGDAGASGRKFVVSLGHPSEGETGRQHTESGIVPLDSIFPLREFQRALLMDDPPITLCIIPDEVYVDSDWSELGCEGVVPRRLSACLVNIYRYEDNHGPVGIHDWRATDLGDDPWT